MFVGRTWRLSSAELAVDGARAAPAFASCSGASECSVVAFWLSAAARLLLLVVSAEPGGAGTSGRCQRPSS